MKIIEDKVTVYPPHAICKADVRTIFKSVPAPWAEGIEIIRLSAAMQHPRIAYYNPYNRTLTIACRGRTRERTLREVLIELAVHALGVQLIWGHRLQGRDAPRLRRVVAPLVTELLPRISRKKVWLDR